MTHSCPVCARSTGTSFFELPNQPVLVGTLWQDAASAQSCPRGDIELAFCSSCGFVWNIRFDPARLEYDRQYDNSLHFSGVFQSYTRRLVERLIDSHDLRGKTIVDIGCGKGDFLVMLCEAGGNAGYGFDPSFEGERNNFSGARIEWSNDHYSENHAHIQADLIASRFVFEHIPDPASFLHMVRRSISRQDRSIVFFEVPNIDLIVRQGSVWDIIYEHCSYFGLNSLTHAFTSCGFEVLRTEETYDHQFLTIDARAANTGRSPVKRFGDLTRLHADIHHFRDSQSRKRDSWRARLDEWRREGRTAAAWGGGAKAVGFFNMLQDREVVQTVVDINPFKQGKHLPGTGQRIISPDALAAQPPDALILMNPIYRHEIEAKLASLGLAPEIFEA